MKPTILSIIFMLTLGSAAVASEDPRLDPSERSSLGLRHMILVAEHELSIDERARLVRLGCTIVRELGGRTYFARVREESNPAIASDVSVRSLRPIVSESKTQASAVRELSRIGLVSRLRVLFHDDVAFDDAKRIIESLGGWLWDPLLGQFGVLNIIEATLPREAVETLVGDDAVLQLHGPMGRIKAMNARAAEMSDVTPLHSAPYDLTGAGVEVSVWDIGLADTAHRELEGRVTTSGSAAVGLHPTHVTGTIAAKGVDPLAKGMAPATRVHQFNVESDFLDQKEKTFTASSIRADNNSYGFQTGWEGTSRTLTWEWWGNEGFGAYSDSSTAIDKITRKTKTLSMYSSGNDNTDSGPNAAPFAHYHQLEIEDEETVYCVSPNGSGNDCPAIPCQSCEILRHPGDGPFGTMSRLASAKNDLGVGAVSLQKTIASFSSRGPTLDGRIKPDLVAKGTQQRSSTPGNLYQSLSGTSMSAPVVTGIAALVSEQWSRTMGGMPEPEMIRALLINGAEDLGNPGPDYTFGYGLVKAKASVDFIRNDNGGGTQIKSGSVSQGTTIEYPLVVSEPRNIRLTIAWSDPENIPFVEKTLISDVDLELIRPDGSKVLPWALNPSTPTVNATTGANSRDTVEMIELTAAPVGEYKVRVIGTAIPSAPQAFALVSNSVLAPNAPPCTDPFEPNDTASDAFGRLASNAEVAATFCSQSDVDFYRFVVSLSGPVTVAVMASGTPLRITLTADGSQPLTTTVGTNSSGSLQTFAGTGTDQLITPINYVVKVEPLGAPGASASYTLRVAYRSAQPERKRATRR